MEKYLWNICVLIECALLIFGVVTTNTILVICASTYILMWQNWLYHGKK